MASLNMKLESFFNIYLGLNWEKVCHFTHIYLLIIYMCLGMFAYLLFRREKARDRPSNDLRIFTDIDYIEPYMKLYQKSSKNFFLYFLIRILGDAFVSKLLHFFYGENYTHPTVWKNLPPYDFQGERYRETWKLEEDEEEDSEEEEDNDIFDTEIWDDGEVEAVQGASPYSVWLYETKSKPFYMYDYDFAMKYKDYLKDDFYIRTYYSFNYKDLEPLDPKITKAVRDREEHGFFVDNVKLVKLLTKIISFIFKIISLFIKIIFSPIYFFFKGCFFIIKLLKPSNIIYFAKSTDNFIKKLLYEKIEIKQGVVKLNFLGNFNKSFNKNFNKNFLKNFYSISLKFYYRIKIFFFNIKFFYYKCFYFIIKILIKIIE